MTIDDQMLSLTVGGLVNLRLTNSQPDDRRNIQRQLGTLVAHGPALDHDIDLIFTSDPLDRDAVFIGANDSGRADHRFLLYQDGRAFAYEIHPERAPSIHISHGSGNVPLLVPLISAVAAAKGSIPLHASAFVWEGRGVLVGGWSKGGKTEALMPFIEHGAAFVGDEWLFLAPDEEVVTGIPEPIRMWDRHIDELTNLRQRVSFGDRARMRSWKQAARVLRLLAPSDSLVGKLADAADRQRFTKLDPARAFGRDQCARQARIDVIFLVMSGQGADIEVQPADGAMVGNLISTSTRFEHLRVLEAELKQEYAFPERPPLLWHAVTRRTEELADRVAHLPAYVVTHPYPVTCGDLYRSMAPVIEGLSP